MAPHSSRLDARVRLAAPRRPQASAQPFLDRHLRHVAEVARRRRHVVPVRRATAARRGSASSAARRRSGSSVHGRFAHRADRVGRAERHGASSTVRRADRAQQCVDDLAHRSRLAVADEVRAAGAGGARREMVERIEVRLRGVVDVGGVDAVVAVADEAQAAGARALDQARQQLVVARAPDQARAQRDGGERRRRWRPAPPARRSAWSSRTAP